jgi:phosphomannomutase
VRAKPPINYQGQLEVIDLALSEEMKTDAVILQNSKVRMIFRPSGTEPKLKCYLQVNGSKAELEELKKFASDYLSDAQ